MAVPAALPLPSSGRVSRAPVASRFPHSATGQPLLWSKWGHDWERSAAASTIADHATSRIRAGDVVLLLHDADHYGTRESWRATAAALPKISDRIADAGLQAASVDNGAADERLALSL